MHSHNKYDAAVKYQVDHRALRDSPISQGISLVIQVGLRRLRGRRSYVRQISWVLVLVADLLHSSVTPLTES